MKIPEEIYGYLIEKGYHYREEDDKYIILVKPTERHSYIEKAIAIRKSDGRAISLGAKAITYLTTRDEAIYLIGAMNEAHKEAMEANYLL